MTAAARFGRPAALGLVGLCAVLFGWGVVLGAASDRPEPVLATLTGSWTEAGLRAAAGDIPVQWLQGYFLALQLLPAVAGLTAALLLLRRADSWFRCYAAVVLGLFGTMNGAIPGVLRSELGGWSGDLLYGLQGLAWVSLFPLMYVFPDGRIRPRWGRWALLAWALLLPYLLFVSWLGFDDPAGPLQSLPTVPLFGSAAWAAVYRYRKISSPEQRTQTRGVVAALVLWFGYVLLVLATPVHGLLDEVSRRGLLTSVVAYLASYLIAALIPAAVAVGILRFRLYDVDVWVNRTLVYVVLAGLVGLAYALVTVAGTWWWRDSELIGPMALAVLLGVGFQPVRTRAQRAVDRFVYGRRKEPYAVLTDLGRRLESVLPPDQVLETLVREVCVALKLPYASATVTASALTASWPPGNPVPTVGRPEVFPLRWQEQQLGELLVVGAPGDNLTATDRDLLDGLARQAGAAIRAATLNDDLRRSRERILDAREDERRRLQRDLHDGLGPTLASLYQRVDLARSMAKTEPEAADRLLAEVGEQTRLVIDDIRSLVRALHPPELELGLGAAIEARAAQLPNLGSVDVDTTALPPLPSAVETAAYRIAVEALTNVARHASATRATVSLSASDRELTISVVDDGTGLPAEPRPGTGLRSMRDRADELGGTCEVTAEPGGGTRVLAVLPLREGER
ncbi:sensor histidine kinase [Kribbella sp. NPDC056345]|uniref:sensor histidine kinase n=1 Tax=Kribbella sp. NPDC056345 TaxID=3345789 RepID=UPI0035DA2B38